MISLVCYEERTAISAVRQDCLHIIAHYYHRFYNDNRKANLGSAAAWRLYRHVVNVAFKPIGEI